MTKVPMLTHSFCEAIYSIVIEIPYGEVATYGQIAALAGCPWNARLVGKALHVSSIFDTAPCHRVVDAQGKTVSVWKEQSALLLAEGVTFRKNGTVDMKKHKWNITS